MTLKTIVLQKKPFCFRNFVPFVVSLLPSPLFRGQILHHLCQSEVSKGIGAIKSDVFKGFVTTLLASTQVFHTKNKIIILDKCKSHGLLLYE